MVPRRTASDPCRFPRPGEARILCGAPTGQRCGWSRNTRTLYILTNLWTTPATRDGQLTRLRCVGGRHWTGEN